MTFSEITKEYFPLLAQYTPILARVHGTDHPELTEVCDIFQQMNEKVNKQQVDHIDLTTEFKQLRTITNHYTVPSDGCETYEATYTMLQEADQAYEKA